MRNIFRGDPVKKKHPFDPVHLTPLTTLNCRENEIYKRSQFAERGRGAL